MICDKGCRFELFDPGHVFFDRHLAESSRARLPGVEQDLEFNLASYIARAFESGERPTFNHDSVLPSYVVIEVLVEHSICEVVRCCLWGLVSDKTLGMGSGKGGALNLFRIIAPTANRSCCSWSSNFPTTPGEISKPTLFTLVV